MRLAKMTMPVGALIKACKSIMCSGTGPVFNVISFKTKYNFTAKPDSYAEQSKQRRIQIYNSVLFLVANITYLISPAKMKHYSGA